MASTLNPLIFVSQLYRDAVPELLESEVLTLTSASSFAADVSPDFSFRCSDASGSSGSSESLFLPEEVGPSPRPGHALVDLMEAPELVEDEQAAAITRARLRASSRPAVNRTMQVGSQDDASHSPWCLFAVASPLILHRSDPTAR